MRTLGKMRRLLSVLAAAAILGALAADLANGWAGAPGRTARLVVCVWGIALPGGTLVAWLTARSDAPLRRLAWASAMIGAIVPLYLHAAGWSAGFALQGWAERVFHIPPLLTGWRGAVWVHGMGAMAWAVLIAGWAFRRVDPELEEIVSIDAPPLVVFWQATLRGAAGGIVAAALWIAVVVATEISVTDLFQVRTYAEVVYVDYALTAEADPGASRFWPGLLLCAVSTAAAYAAIGHWRAKHPFSFRRPPRRFPLGRYRAPSGVLLASASLLIVGIPGLNLCYWLGLEVTQSSGKLARHWVAGKAITILADAPSRYFDELVATAELSMLVAVAALATAAGSTWLAWRVPRTAALWQLAAAAMLAVPGPVVGATVIWLMNRPEIPWAVWLYDRTLAPPALALLGRTWAIAHLLLASDMARVPRNQVEMARCQGAPERVVFWQVVAPQLGSAALASLGVAALVATSDVSASILVLPPGVNSVSMRLFNLLHYGVDDQVAALSLVMALATIVAGGLASRSIRESNRR